jgi:hypothetical protein
VVALALSMWLQTVVAPAVASVEPPYLVAYRPSELVIRGEGFTDDCRVLLGVPGRMVPVAAVLVDEGEIRVELKAGVGPQPATRLLEVDCGARARTRSFGLAVLARAPTATPESGTEQADYSNDDETTAAHAPPRALVLDPARVSAGEPLILTVTGESFAEGAEVRVLANAAAGTTRPPSYEMVSFPTEYASPRVLVVDFERGFAPSPRLRRVVVVNPDGAGSAPLFLEIVRRSQ